MPENTTANALRGAYGAGARPSLRKPRLLIAGATGALGNEVLRRLASSGRYAHVEVLAREPITTGIKNVGITLAGAQACSEWPPRLQTADVGVVMFEPPRLYYDRERALWTPAPEELPALASWLRQCGVATLVIVMPHAQGGLPDALKRGLASLDEHTVAAIGFERILLVRSAQKKPAARQQGFLNRVAAWMLSTLSYMIPQTEQPVRPSKLAEFVDAALAILPPGTHVASPELLWRAAQARTGDAASSGLQDVVKAWLNTPVDEKA